MKNLPFIKTKSGKWSLENNSANNKWLMKNTDNGGSL